ncbi:NAD-dependent epimerase/dehydratase family protein [Methylotenera sp.]|uniref:NAD-dependent epimerase/dehydratase family protein n=1 Tax=Methylotenera sp. TaxID=2051956 RepID=UPI002ED97A9B
MVNLQSYIRGLKGPILVAGASGFVGANLFKMVADVRDDVFAVVRSHKGWRLADVHDEKIITADVTNYSAIKNLINSIGPQTVFDCLAYGAYSFEQDANLVYQTNFQSIINFIELLATRPFTAYVHAGSSSEYGTNCSGPSESALCEPNSHYAVSKVAISNYLFYVGKQRNFPCVNLRLYSVYGPLEDTSRLIPNVIRHALNGKLPPLVHPLTSRDFVYIDDVCAAFIMAAAKMHPGLYGESFNIGTGEKTTISELVEVAKAVFNVEEEPRFDTMEGRSWDLAEWYSNPSAARESLGWSATVKLRDGIQLMAQWVSQLSDNQILASTKKSNSDRRRSVSAIVACYKDAQAIPVMHKRLTDTFNKLKIDYEIIFVNDGSPDDSASVIEELSANDPHVVGITHSRNFGSQMAFRSGMELSTKDSVVLLDGDLQDPPELIEDFYAQWERGFEVVYGRRVKRNMAWHWGLMYKLFYRIFAMFSYIKIPLDAGDFSLMDKRVVRWLLNCPERDLFLRGLRAYVGFKQTGVDYVRPERVFGVTTNSFIKNIDWAKKGIFSFSNTPLTILTTVGVVTLALSTLTAIVVAGLRLFVPDIAPRGITTLLITVLMFGSFNIFAVGLVGEYVAKIMSEVKRRPRLIRSALIRNGESTSLLPDGKDVKWP